MHDIHWIDRAELARAGSHDPDTRVGAVIAINEKFIAQGANRLPNGVKLLEERLKRPAKYNWMVHAEVNCIHSAIRYDKSKIDFFYATLYSTLPLCGECMKSVIQSGIRRVVAPDRMNFVAERSQDWQLSMWRGEEMAQEANVVMVKT